MKAQMKKRMIDANELIARLNASGVDYNAEINDIIKDMPTVNICVCETKTTNYPHPCELSVDMITGEETVSVEEPPAYVQRMITEYRNLKDKYNKLHRMLVKHKAGTLDFEPTCPIELLEHQADVMSEYLHILEVRAEIENVKL